MEELRCALCGDMLEGDEDWLCQSCEDDAPVDHEPDWGFWVSAPGPRTESGEPW